MILMSKLTDLFCNLFVWWDDWGRECFLLLYSVF